LITLLQFSENLSDRRSADAVRARVDWKYLLGLDLTGPGFDASVLSEFRSRLVADGAEALLFDTLLNLCRERGLLLKRGRQRTDATHVLGTVRSLNRLGCAIETLRVALNALAVAAPDWLRAHTEPSWIERYGRPIDDFHIPQGEAARRACAEEVGSDGHRLLVAVDAGTAPGWLREVPAVVVLRRVWLQNFRLGEGSDAGPHGGDRVRWRTEADGIPPALAMVATPYDPDVHYAKMRATTWIGYKVHVTETCDDGGPPLIVHVATTSATVVDRVVLDSLHTALAAKDLLPARHLIDAAYTTPTAVTAARDYGVALTGPVPKDNRWQALSPW
jgi:transposase